MSRTAMQGFVYSIVIMRLQFRVEDLCKAQELAACASLSHLASWTDPLLPSN